MDKKKYKLPEVPPFVDILGTPWKIETLTSKQEPYFEKDNICGYCSGSGKRIVLLDIANEEEYEAFQNEELDNLYKRTLRHEIVHAFLYSSGLASDSLVYKHAWARNEEMIDWIAIQGCKIYKAWQDANCLDVMSPERYTEWKVATAK